MESRPKNDLKILCDRKKPSLVFQVRYIERETLGSLEFQIKVKSSYYILVCQCVGAAYFGMYSTCLYGFICCQQNLFEHKVLSLMAKKGKSQVTIWANLFIPHISNNIFSYKVFILFLLLYKVISKINKRNWAKFEKIIKNLKVTQSSKHTWYAFLLLFSPQ